MKILRTIALWLIAVVLVVAGVFTYVVAAYIAAFHFHMKATTALKTDFAGLFLLQMASLIAGLFVMARLSMRTPTVANPS